MRSALRAIPILALIMFLGAGSPPAEATKQPSPSLHVDLVGKTHEGIIAEFYETFDSGEPLTKRRKTRKPARRKPRKRRAGGPPQVRCPEDPDSGPTGLALPAAVAAR